MPKARDKLSYGEGSVYETRDGRWLGAVVGPDGRRRYTSRAKTESEALRALDRLRATLEAGNAPLDSRMTVATLLQTWLDTVVRPNRSANTTDTYASVIRNHLLPGLGRWRLGRLTLPAVQQFIAGRTAAGYAPSTVGLMRTVLCAALRYAEESDLVSKNVARLSHAPSIRKTQFKALGPGELATFVAAVESDRMGPLLILLAGCGLRIGEALGLTWAAVDLESRVLRVVQQLEFRGKSFSFQRPKEQASVADVPMPGFVVSALRSHRVAMQAERLAAGNWPPSDLVFVTEQGRPVHEGAVRTALRRLMADAGLPALKPHELRHTYATLLQVQGTDPNTMKELLRHSRIATTLGLYPLVLEASKRAAADSLDEIARST